MHRIAWLFLVLCTFCATTPASWAGDDDIAIAIVYDTSGSMSTPVKDAQGKMTPKFQIGNRAVENIVAQLEKFAATSPKKLQVGLYVFSLQGGKEAVPVGPFAPAKIRDWVAAYKKPDGGTPLGNATAEAAQALAKVKAGARHVLVITDGENTIGPPPEQKIAAINKEGMKTGNLTAFHFVAFDVNAAVFAAIKKQGATLLSAADEKQLNERLTFVLEDKILLEKE
jgi:Ca-activated chloride channel homolog